MTLLVKKVNLFFLHDTDSWCCIAIPSLVTKCSVVQKILSRQTFIDMLNLHCALDLECSNHFFSTGHPAYNRVLSNQVGFKGASNWEDSKNSHILIMKIVKQRTNFSTWHSGCCCCITVPSLVTKCSVVHKVSSGQTFIDIFNLHCDGDLEQSNPFFSAWQSALW